MSNLKMFNKVNTFIHIKMNAFLALTALANALPVVPR